MNTMQGAQNVNTKYVFPYSLKLLSETFIILRIIQPVIIINVQRYACEIIVILVRF